MKSKNVAWFFAVAVCVLGIWLFLRSKSGTIQTLETTVSDPVEAPTIGAEYALRVAGSADFLYVPLTARNATRLAVKNSLVTNSFWKWLATTGGEHFLRSRNQFEAPFDAANPGNRVYATNADVHLGEWKENNNVVIAVQADGQTWTWVDTERGDKSFWIKSNLGKHIGKPTDEDNSLYMGLSAAETDGTEGLVKWVVLKKKADAARWQFMPPR